jgi:4-amino-4-deoxy-L-arabinose transferase-like glycosyltransferase
MSNPVRARALAPVVVIAVLFFGGLGVVPLTEPDEGRYTEIPREMLATRDFVTPRLNGVLYFEKPPLYYWLNASAIALLGVNAFASRLWNAIFAVAGLGLAYALARRFAGRRTAGLAVVVLASAPLYLAMARLSTTDMTLSVLMAATLTCFWLAHEDEGRRARLLWYGMFASAALAALSKGLVGVVLPGAVIGLYIAVKREWRVLARVPWIGGVAAFCLIAVPWHVAMAMRHPDFLWFYFIHEHVLRYATAEAGRQQFPGFLLAVLLAGCLPWTGLLPAAARRMWAAIRDRAGERRSGLIFLWLWLGVILLFFSLSRSQLVPYILPVVPAMAVLLAETVAGGGENRLARIGAAVGSGLGGLLGLPLLVLALGLAPRVVDAGGVVPVAVAFAVAGVLGGATAAVVWLRANTTAALAASALVGVSLVGAAWALAPHLTSGRSSLEFANVLRERLRPGGGVFSYRCYPQSLPPYLGRLISVVGYQGEMAFGISHLSEEERARRFPRPEEFAAVWGSRRTVFLFLDKRDLPRLTADGLAPGTVVLDSGSNVLLVNHDGSGHDG